MILKIAIGAYGALSLVAAIAQGKYKNITVGSALLMGTGGLLIIATLFINSVLSVYVLAAGVLLVHISAIINGYKMYGRINKSHHLIRIIASIFLVASQAVIFIR